MHAKKPLPKPDPAARPVRSKPILGGVVVQFLATMVMLNGFRGMLSLQVTDLIEDKVRESPRSVCIDHVSSMLTPLIPCILSSLAVSIILSVFVCSHRPLNNKNHRPQCLSHQLGSRSRHPDDRLGHPVRPLARHPLAPLVQTLNPPRRPPTRPHHLVYLLDTHPVEPRVDAAP